MYYSDKIFTKSRIYILTPKLIVFYNGSEPIPDILEQHLSDSFIEKSARSDLEVTAHIYNINYGHNIALMEKCHKLFEYCKFVDMVKKALNSNTDIDLNLIINSVIDECIAEDILTDILSKERERVMTTILAQFDAEKYIEYERDYGRSEGIELGRSEGIELGRQIFRLYKNGKSPDEIASTLNIPIDEVSSFIEV